MSMSPRPQKTSTQLLHRFHVVCRELVLLRAPVLSTTSHVARRICQHKVHILSNRRAVLQFVQLFHLSELLFVLRVRWMHHILQHPDSLNAVLAFFGKSSDTIGSIASKRFVLVFSSGSVDDCRSCIVHLSGLSCMDVWPLNLTIVCVRLRRGALPSFSHYICEYTTALFT